MFTPFFGQVSSNLLASSMPELTYSMFDPGIGQHQMEAHNYQVINLQSLRSFKDFYLANFLKLPLKSGKDYNDAFDIVLQTSMREYLSNYVVLMPADWPGQFFPRQIVYQKARQATSISTVPQGSSTHPLCCHSHFRALACRPWCWWWYCFRLHAFYEAFLRISFSREEPCRQAKTLEN